MDVLDVPEVHSSRASNWVGLFDDFTDRFVGPPFKERDEVCSVCAKGRERERVVHAPMCHIERSSTKCSSYSEGQLPHTQTHTHNCTHTMMLCVSALIGWFFCTLLLFVSMIWQQTFAWLKRKALPPWGYSLSHPRPPPHPLLLCHAFVLGNFWLCWLLDKLPTAAAAALEQTVCPADKCSRSCSLCSSCHCCFCSHSLPLSFSIPLPLVPRRIVVLSGIDKWCTISAPSLTCQ